MPDKDLDDRTTPRSVSPPQLAETAHIQDVAVARLWLTYTVAPDWYADALAEATASLVPGERADLQRQHRNHIRWEIVLAVCCAESYIVEWVRDVALKGALDRLSEYFPPTRTSGVAGKWKNVTRSLESAGVLASIPDYSNQIQTEWNNLVSYRDRLVHARLARPDSAGVPAREKPLPDFIP